MLITHILKVIPEFYEAQICLQKSYEISQNDSNFCVGDLINLIEIDTSPHEDYAPTGRACMLKITHIITSDEDCEFIGIQKGYCILSTKFLCGNQ